MSQYRTFTAQDAVEYAQAVWRTLTILHALVRGAGNRRWQPQPGL